MNSNVIYLATVISPTEDEDVYLIKPAEWESGNDSRLKKAQLSSPIPTSSKGSGMYSTLPEGQICLVYSNSEYIYDIIIGYLNLPGAGLLGTQTRDIPEPGSFFIKAGGWDTTTFSITRSGTASLDVNFKLGMSLNAETGLFEQRAKDWKVSGANYQLFSKNKFLLTHYEREDWTGYLDWTDENFWKADETLSVGLVPNPLMDAYEYNPAWEIRGSNLKKGHLLQIVTKQSIDPILPIDKNTFTWEFRGEQTKENPEILYEFGVFKNNLQVNTLVSEKIGTKTLSERLLYSKLLVPFVQTSVTDPADFQKRETQDYITKFSEKYTEDAFYEWKMSYNPNFTDSGSYSYKVSEYTWKKAQKYEDTTNLTQFSEEQTKDNYNWSLKINNGNHTIFKNKTQFIQKSVYDSLKWEKELDFAQKSLQTVLDWGNSEYLSKITDSLHQINWDFGQKIQFKADSSGFLWETEKASVKLDSDKITFKTSGVTLEISANNMLINGIPFVLQPFLDFLQQNLSTLVLCSAPGSPGPMFPAASGQFAGKNSATLKTGGFSSK